MARRSSPAPPICPGRHQPQREPDSIVIEGAREHNLASIAWSCRNTGWS